MRFVCIALALVAHAAAPDRAAAQDRSRAPARTDQTVSVARGSVFALQSLAGTVTIRAWEKDAVRVRASHSARAHVSILTVKSTVSVQSDGTRGPSDGVTYEIDVPRWMPVTVEVTYDDITIEGTESSVSAETVRGNITIRGGTGSVTADSVQGSVVVEGVKGRIGLTSVNDLIRVDGAVGDISASTTNGAIRLSRIQSSTVTAETVNGGISYNGTVADDGHYSLTTHNGDIVVSIPDGSNITFDVRTYNGRFSPDMAVTGNPPARRGARGIYTLGNGSARMELASFGGSISLRAAGPSPRTGRHDGP